MRLIFNQEKCKGTNECVSACKKKPNDKRILSCRQCALEEADCFLACPKKAVYVASNGALAIDYGKCDSCGKCVSACKYGAISKNKDGKIIKCDLCLGEETIRCARSCANGALRTSEGIGGWRMEKCDEKEGKYRAGNFALTSQEEKLLKLLTHEFREGAQDGKGKEGNENDLKSALKRLCSDGGINLQKERGELLLKIAGMDLFGNGILDMLLKDEMLEEISVLGKNRAIRVYHREKGWLETNCFIDSEEYAINLINRIARKLGRRISYQFPRLNATLDDGSRLHATVSPINPEGFEITIRKFRENPLTIVELIENGTLSSEAAAFLWMAMFSDVSLIIGGNTGSGKTTLLNALFSFVPETERTVITEETPEIRILQKHKIRMIANEELGIGMKDVAKDTLRMRPDRVIIGEVRTKEEFEALFDSLLAGQAKGTYATMHAQSANEAVNRMRTFGMEKEDLEAIDLIVTVRRIPVYDSENKRHYEIRRMTEIAEMQNGETANLFSYDSEKKKLVCDAKVLLKSGIFRKMTTNYGMNQKGLLEEMERRKEFLEGIAKEGGKDASAYEIGGKINRYMFSEKSE